MESRKLVLENGLEFYGKGFGASTDAVCETVFNTSMVGYQEIISDLSYYNQLVVTTYPLIGNYGINDEDYEAKTLKIGGLVVREYNDQPSNFRYTKTLGETLEESGIPGISEIDTRRLTRIIRDEGCQRAMLTDFDTPLDEALRCIRAYTMPADQVARVSCKKRWFSRTPNAKFDVVAVDCGIKLNLIRMLNARGCNVTVVPYHTSAETVLGMRPDGVFLSNGPGNPEDVGEVIDLIRALRGRLPLFGVCLGHQLISLAYGAKTYKLKFGHHGGNHPVRDLATGKIEITSQNHNFAVDLDSLAGTGLEATHINLLDGTVEGVKCRRDRVFSVQYHPESAPGPQDSTGLFDVFLAQMAEGRM